IKRFPIDIIFNGKRLEIPALYKWFIDTANIYAEVDFDTTDDVTLVRKLRWRGGSSFEVREWSQNELVEIFGTTQEKLKDLGSFKLCFLWFNRSDIKNDLLDYSISEVKSELNLWCGGYAIYRDNFRIGLTGSLEDDWLKADSGSLRSQGFSFNRYQTVGALDITKKDNPKLVDAANREKLVNCEELDLLKDILT
ncbi:histidine kinase, partial [Klebsiella variicola]|nr:histidine kinase [Klebsiella variicola]